MPDSRYMIGTDGMQYALPAEISNTLQAIVTEQAVTREQLRSVFRLLEEQKEQNKALNELCLSVRDLANAQKIASDELGRLSKEVDCLKNKPVPDEVARLRTDVDGMRMAPARNWDVAKAAGIAAVVTGLVTWAITRLGE